MVNFTSLLLALFQFLAAVDDSAGGPALRSLQGKSTKAIKSTKSTPSIIGPTNCAGDIITEDECCVESSESCKDDSDCNIGKCIVEESKFSSKGCKSPKSSSTKSPTNKSAKSLKTPSSKLTKSPKSSKGRCYECAPLQCDDGFYGPYCQCQWIVDLQISDISLPSPPSKVKNTEQEFEFDGTTQYLNGADQMGPSTPFANYTGQVIYGGFNAQNENTINSPTYSINNVYHMTVAWLGGPIDVSGQRQGPASGIFMVKDVDFNNAILSLSSTGISFTDDFVSGGHSKLDKLSDIEIVLEYTNPLAPGVGGISITDRKYCFVLYDSTGWHIACNDFLSTSCGGQFDTCTSTDTITLDQTALASLTWFEFDPFNNDDGNYTVGTTSTTATTPSFLDVKFLGFRLDGDRSPSRASRAFIAANSFMAGTCSVPCEH